MNKVLMDNLTSEQKEVIRKELVKAGWKPFKGRFEGEEYLYDDINKAWIRGERIIPEKIMSLNINLFFPPPKRTNLLIDTKGQDE